MSLQPIQPGLLHLRRPIYCPGRSIYCPECGLTYTLRMARDNLTTTLKHKGGRRGCSRGANEWIFPINASITTKPIGEGEPIVIITDDEACSDCHFYYGHIEVDSVRIVISHSPLSVSKCQTRVIYPTALFTVCL